MPARPIFSSSLRIVDTCAWISSAAFRSDYQNPSRIESIDVGPALLISFSSCARPFGSVFAALCSSFGTQRGGFAIGERQGGGFQYEAFRLRLSRVAPCRDRAASRGAGG